MYKITLGIFILGTVNHSTDLTYHLLFIVNFLLFGNFMSTMSPQFTAGNTPSLNVRNKLQWQ